MDNSEIKDPLFLEAVNYIDRGDYIQLQDLLDKNPALVGTRLELPEGGYFKNPYLLWFIADNPIRVDTLPKNIVEITRLIMEYVRIHDITVFQEQIDYTLGLVVTGRIPRESGSQIELMDLLLDAGAIPGNGHGALAHGNVDAARHLLKRGGNLTLTTAICLELKEDISHLAQSSSKSERQIALIAAAFFGKSEMIDFLIHLDIDVNSFIDSSSGFHSHATALHQAVYSGSMESVILLIEAGANLNTTDRIYQGTPLGWSVYMQEEEQDVQKKKQYAAIETYLREIKNNQL
ncbi:MAG: ankyrin repeat domain-containing protein [Saprospiraceae bacterium]